MNNPNHIFTLDIGTRSVIGLMLEKQENVYRIKDMLVKEHNERSMLDGQIHDVVSVANIIQHIAEELSKKHGPLKQVCLAAAGRALLTKQGKASVTIKGKPFMERADILHLELTAVQDAQWKIASEHQRDFRHNYYCVGYSVLHYLLDNEPIGNLLQQQGEEASVEVIATFLPKIVVESLLAAVERAGLEMAALTLEPIAAINVLIPPTMRRLNVALVDIGAGTSDIAITADGTIVAYGMVPFAGDEITEAISDQYLLDFPLAEKAKRELTANDEITVKDILGFEHTVSKQEVIAKIEYAIQELATHISNEILRLNNNQPPKAVMLVGGGSLTPELSKLVAQKLHLPENRIGIRGIDAISNLQLNEELKHRPDLVTPIGIAIAASANPIHYITVYVNDQPIRLFDMKQLTVGDCLLSAGIEMKKLYGKPGMAKIITVNGKEVTIPGTYGKPPLLLKNGAAVDLDDIVENGDRIVIEKGNDGAAPTVMIKDIIGDKDQKTIILNGEEYKIETMYYLNGKIANETEYLQDNDKLTSYFPRTIKDLCIYLNKQEYITNAGSFYIYIDKAKVTIPANTLIIEKNGLQANGETPIYDGDAIVIREGKAPTVMDALAAMGESLYYTVPITFNGQEIILKKETLQVYRDEQTVLTENDPIYCGEHLTTVRQKMTPFIFQDVFRYVDITMPNDGSTFTLLRNDIHASFHDEIAPGDRLELKWDKQ